MKTFVENAWRKRPSSQYLIIFILLGIVLVVAGGFAVWLQWEWLRSSEDGKASNGDTLRNVGFIVAGVVALGFAFWRAQVAERQADAAQEQTATAQQSLLNERYQRGAGMLGSPVLSVRLGGIYALQRLAEEYPGQYHLQVMRLFCTFVRNPLGEDDIPFDLREVPADVQAVITAIGERSSAGQLIESKTEFTLDLRRVRLKSADMRELAFTGANLQYAYLSGADLVRIELSGAYLLKTNLSSAVLVRANFSNARLTEADFSHARLTRANFSNARLAKANLSGALLARANFSRADLTEADLSGDRSVYANFSNAAAIRTNLCGSDLSGGDFSGALLWDANLSDANLANANLSGADLTDANLSGADLEGAIVSGAVLGTEPIRTATGEIVRPGRYARLSQLQLDQTVADPDNPPIIPNGSFDPETGDPLVWRGGLVNLQSEKS